MQVRVLFVLTLATAIGGAAEPDAKIPPGVVEHLYRGDWSAAEQRLRRELATNSENNDARLQLGFTLTFRALERFTAFQWEHGARFDRALIFIPGGALPPENPTPNRVSYPAWRRALETLERDLEYAESTLAGIKGDRASFRVEIAKLKWDPDGDGKPQPILPPVESLNELAEPNPNLEIAFDATDGIWLRGYCRLLTGGLNLLLSVDLRELFYQAAGEAYRDPILPEAFTKLTADERNARWTTVLFQIQFLEPDRLHAARLDWIRVTELSDDMWKSAEKEADDDREWIPNPRQTGVLRQKVSPEMITAWSAAMAETRALLAGGKLQRPWVFLGRNAEAKRGVNIRRLMDDPPKGPIVNWILQAPAAYLEEGELSDETAFRRLGDVFGRNLFWFGLWVN